MRYLVPKMLFTIALVLGASCTPVEELTVEYDVFDLGVSGELRAVIHHGEHFYFAGGFGWEEGWVVRSSEDFAQADLLLETENLLFDLCFFKDGIYASSLGNGLYGVSLEGSALLSFFVEEDQSLYGLAANATDLYAVSGANGRTAGKIWKYNKEAKALEQAKSYTNSFQDVQLTSSHLLACGFGQMAQCDLSLSDCRVDYGFQESFQAIDCVNDTLCYAVAQSGGMVKSVNGGRSWYTTRPGNRVLVANIPFQDIEMLNDSVGYVCGRFGHVWKTENAGRDWLRLSGIPDTDYFCLLYRAPYLYVGGAGGRVLRIRD